MPVDLTNLTAAIAALTAQATATVGTEDSAEVIIEGFAAQITKAVTDALTADAAANQASIDTATKAIADVTAQFTGSAKKLGDAIATTNPPAPAPAP